MKALQAVRVCQMLLAMIPMTRLGGANLQAQVGISSGMAQVALVIRAPSHASLSGAGASREIGPRGELREAAVRIHLLVNSGYRLVARNNPGSTSRVWIRVEDDVYQELVPGTSVTLPAGSRGSSEREVRYLTDGRASFTEQPVRLEVVIDPVI